MFKCERCGSAYSALHAAAMQNCPRCEIRDKVAAPLTFTAFTQPQEFETQGSEGPASEAPQEGAAHATS